MDNVRLGIVGLGNMGKAHMANIRAGKVPGMSVTALCESHGPIPPLQDGETAFTDVSEMIKSGKIDAILICTPHFSHTTIGIEALTAGLHVLVEKPISVHKADCERLIAAHTDKTKIFAAMFNMRTNATFKKVKDLIDSGEIGAVRRVHWEVTNWFRTNYYYATGGWRGTWKGEGGGVLMNQCPHNLDLFQWMFGMPQRIRGFCQFGRYHEVEVEDNVTAYWEWASGATGVFITSTGEAPGTNRLELCGTRGRLVLENSRLTFTRNETDMLEFSRTAKTGFARPEVWNVEVPFENTPAQHATLTQNFVDAILDGTPLVAPGADGMNSVELANAMLFSSLTGQTIDLPLDGAAYEQKLQALIAGSRFEKKVVEVQGEDFTKSFVR